MSTNLQSFNFLLHLRKDKVSHVLVAGAPQPRAQDHARALHEEEKNMHCYRSGRHYSGPRIRENSNLSGPDLQHGLVSLTIIFACQHEK